MRPNHIQPRAIRQRALSWHINWSHDRARIALISSALTFTTGMMGLLSGRSSHGARKSSSHSSSASTRPRKRRDDGEVAEEAEVPKPDLEELRRRRASYYSVSPRERRRTSTVTASHSKPKSSTVSGSKSASTSDRRHRSSRHKSSRRESDKAERHNDESQRRTEEYVYDSRPSVGLDPIAEEPTEARSERRRSEKRHSTYSSLPRRRSSPRVVDEVTPDDSISQVGEREVSSSRRSGVYSRPFLRRSSTTSARLDRVAEAPTEIQSVRSSKGSSRQAPSLLGSTVRRHSTTSVPEQPRLVECLTCGSDDIPATKSAKLSCGHRMCQDCLKRIFEMSVKDPAHMPPKCCSEEHIPLRHVEKLFDVKFKVHWNRKYQEYNTKNRIYCPTLKCGEWIKPSHIHTYQGRKYALCPRCKTKVCTLCNNKMHRSTDCPNDPEIAKLVEQAKKEGWQRCYSCNFLVEKQEGCNHMTCRCTAEFCIVCGAKWKTCDCPWFNYNNLPHPDRLNEMRVPEPIQMIYRQVFRDAVNPIPPPPPRPAAAEPARDIPRGPLPEVTYQREMDERREQERRDADLARRLQLATLMDPDGDDRPRRHGGLDFPGLGNVARHFMNDDFVQNAANVVMSAFGDANLGRRGERASGRRRRARPADQNENDPGLVPDFLGDESVLGPRPRPY